MNHSSSRDEYQEYRQQVKQRGGPKTVRPTLDGDDGVARSRQRSFAVLLREFLRLLRSHRRAVAFALATLTVATILKLIPPAATKLAIDYVLGDRTLPKGLTETLPLPQSRLSMLVCIAGAVVVLSIVATLMHLWGRWYATRAVNRMQAGLRKTVFEHAVRLPLHRIFQLKSGGAASILREDAGNVADLIFSMIYNPWRAIIQFIGSLIVLLCVDWRMMLAGVVLLPIVYVTHRTWISRIRPLYRDIRSQRQHIDGQTTEAFGGIRVVRTFGREKSETSRFLRANHLMIRQQLFVWWLTRLIGVVWEMFIPLASSALLLYGGYRILQDKMTLGDLTMFLFYMAMLLGPLATLAASATAFQNSLAALDRILDLLAEPLEAVPAPDAVSLDPHKVRGQIELRGVSFHYPGTEQLVLSDIDLAVQAGETVALVGRSGAGKTTLTNLVARFYDPTAGAVLLDGVDLRDISVESLRRLLGIVEQDVFLFDGTIAENIAYAVRNATREEIQRAAHAANAHEFITELDRGYDTLIGERGVRLSGGQRQRLAIARAVLADPRILILDEATSNLDSESERLIQQSLAELMRGRTSFVIAHRLSTITNADRIVVLQEGRIVECGTHDQLLARRGRYRQMVELQMDIPQQA
jgi:ATP-binding cassette subfamily B protein/subfamily B ATP-binding cassette protein MsbA